MSRFSRIASIFSITIVAASFAIAQTPARLAVDVREFGAQPDGKSASTKAIQAAIDTCHEKGGGIVSFPPGQYISGTILLKDHVTLHLAEGATLLGSTDIHDYQLIDGFRDGKGSQMGFCFVGASDATDIGITGPGTIDGRGKEVLAARAEEDRGKRPFLARFVRCKEITIDNVHLQSSAAWAMHLSRCEKVSVSRVSILNRGLPNNDGIDIDSSETVTIRDCAIDSGDDAICLKTTSLAPCSNIEVSGCKLKSHWAGIKCGTESVANFENIRITNCQIRDTEGGGIKLTTVDGAILQNVLISGIQMENVRMPIFLRLGARLKTFREGDQPRPIGAARDIRITDVHAKTTSPVAIVMSGIPDHPIENVTLERIEVTVPGGGTPEQARVSWEEKIDAYPEITMFGKESPAFGLVARHVTGLRASDVTIETEKGDARPAIVCQDAEKLEFSNWKLPLNPNAECLVRFESVRGALTQGFELKGEGETFLLVEGTESGEIRMRGTPLKSVKNSLKTAKDVPSQAVIIE